MALLILQLVVSLFGISAIVAETFDKDPNQPTKTWKKVTRVLGVGSLLIGGLVLIIGHQQGKQKDLEARQDLERQLARHQEQLTAAKQIQDSQLKQISQGEDLAANQKKTIDAQDRTLALSKTLLNVQNRGVQQLNLLSLDRMFAGIEISYKPSAREWTSVVQIYRTIAPPAGEKSYYDAPIIATRIGSYWRIDFEPVSLKEGQKWFPPLSTEDEKNKVFERIIQTAALPLHITWGNGSETLLEPWRGDYPSALRISQDRFVFTLRPPFLELNLASLYKDSRVMLRSRNPWRQSRREVTVHSLDPAVKLDQVLPLEWKNDVPNKMERVYPIKLYPYASGPHRLNITFRTLSP